MFKRILSIVLFCTLLLSANITFADSRAVSVNESFDNYALNEVPASVIVNSGVDARVVEREGNDKAFYAKAWGGAPVAFDFSANADYKNVCLEADIKISSSKI